MISYKILETSMMPFYLKFMQTIFEYLRFTSLGFFVIRCSKCLISVELIISATFKSFFKSLLRLVSLNFSEIFHFENWLVLVYEK